MRKSLVFTACFACLLAVGGAAQSARTTFPGKNGLIAYSAPPPTAPLSRAIYVSNADGGGLRQLTQPGSSVDSGARWSPDGRRLAFARCGGGVCQIFVVDAGGSGLKELTVAGSNVDPAWSPDGKRIAYASNASGHFQIVVMNADGSGQRALTAGDGTTDDTDPDWSPDGSKVVWTRSYGPPSSSPSCEPGAPGSSDIWVLNAADGTGQQALAVPDPGLGFAKCLAGPRWSPDGKQLLVNIGATDLFDAGARIGVSPAAGGSPAVLGAGVPSSVGPLWSPDGKTILFTSESFPFLQGPSGIYAVPAGGGAASPLAVAGLPSGATVEDWGAAVPPPIVAKKPAKKPPLCKKGQKSTKKHPCRKR
jgi:Tol biopolymer transport system component